MSEWSWIIVLHFFLWIHIVECSPATPTCTVTVILMSVFYGRTPCILNVQSGKKWLYCSELLVTAFCTFKLYVRYGSYFSCWYAWYILILNLFRHLARLQMIFLLVWVSMYFGRDLLPIGSYIWYYVLYHSIDDDAQYCKTLLIGLWTSYTLNNYTEGGML